MIVGVDIAIYAPLWYGNLTKFKFRFYANTCDSVVYQSEDIIVKKGRGGGEGI